MSTKDRHRPQDDDDDDGPPTRPQSSSRGDAPPNLAASLASNHSAERRTAAAAAVAPPPPPQAGSPHPMIPVRDALRTVLLETSRAASLRSSPSFETLPIHTDSASLLHRTLAEDVRCPSPGYPAYDASIMDGYAVNSSESRPPSSDVEGAAGGEEGSWTHEVLSKVYAGDDDVASRSPRHGLPGTVYVTTGAPVPPGYDCVIPVELSTLSPDGSRIKFSSDAVVTEGKWIRKVGCDIAPGEVVLEAGCVLDPVGIGLCVQVGVKEVKVRRLTRVGVLSTGNELIDPLNDASNSAAKHGHIPDVNRPLLLTLLSTYNNCATVDLGIIPDEDVPSLAARVEGMLRTVDVMVTTGGISAGEKDVMERVFVDGLGAKVHFGRMCMKPGKPTTFLTLTAEDGRRKLIFCLPGNPVSAGVCAELLVRPSLDLLHSCPVPMGEEDEEAIEQLARNAMVHPEIAATLTSDIKLDVERPEYHRVKLTYHHPANPSSPGHYTADSTGVQRSSRLLSLRNADGLLVLPQGVKGGKTKALRGERYTVLISRRGFGGAGTVKAKGSVHLNGNEGRLRVRVVLVPSNEKKTGEDEDRRGGPLERLGERVVRSLGGEGKFRVASSARHDGPESDIERGVLPDDAIAGHDARVDVCVVVCAEGRSFRSNLDVSAAIRKGLTKNADAMALQMRRGAASVVPIAALFEFVAGYASAPDEGGEGGAGEANAGTVVLCVPAIGLEGALGSLGGQLLGHAVKIGRGGSGGGATSHGRHGHDNHHHHHH